MNDLKPIEAVLGKKLPGIPGCDEISNGGRRLGMMGKLGVGKPEPVGGKE
jgi:hypothetical protein